MKLRQLMRYRQTTRHVNDSGPHALRAMGKAAREAADMWRFREWAGTIAAQAPPRDYWAQLERIYRAILDRWSYVKESDEWVHGSGPSLLAHVLGLKYNAPPGTPIESIDPGGVTVRQKGFGDCDDVAALVAAAALAIGMRPVFRVAWGDIGAHVSTMVEAEAGKWISVDPVGHPQHKFGWVLPAPNVRYYDLHGRPISAITSTPPKTLAGAEGRNATMHQTQLCDYTGRSMGALAGHTVALAEGDFGGERTLAVPSRYANMIAQGRVMDGMPAVDQYGHTYEYDADRDLWLSHKLNATRLASMSGPMGGIRDRRRKRRQRRRRKRRAALRKVASRAISVHRRVAAKVLQNRAAQRVVGRALMAVGIPSRLTVPVLRVSGKILERGGLPAVLRMIRKNPRKLMMMVAQAAAGKHIKRFNVGKNLTQFAIKQAGRSFRGAPVVALSGVPGVFHLDDITISSQPEMGRYYRVKPGDNLLKIAEQAQGRRKGRLSVARMINDAAANAVFMDPSKANNLFKGGWVAKAFYRNYSSDPSAAAEGQPGDNYGVLWIPAAPGDEPVVEVEEVEEVEETPPEKDEETGITPEEVEPDDTVPPDADKTEELPPVKEEEVAEEEANDAAEEEAEVVPPIEPEVGPKKLPEKEEEVEEVEEAEEVGPDGPEIVVPQELVGGIPKKWLLAAAAAILFL